MFTVYVYSLQAILGGGLCAGMDFIMEETILQCWSYIRVALLVLRGGTSRTLML